MSLLEKFLLCASAYVNARGITESSLSNYIFNGGQKIRLLRSGGDLGSRKYEKAMRWLSDNWPDDTPWPEGVERPVPAASEGA